MLEPLAPWYAASPESEWEFETDEDRAVLTSAGTQSSVTVRPRLCLSGSIWTRPQFGPVLIPAS